jgi:regulator of nonsense transcripts 1
MNSLQASMIQFSKFRRSLVKSMDQFCRHETNARDYIPSLHARKSLILLGFPCLLQLVVLVLIYPVAPGVLGSAVRTVATLVPSSPKMLDRQAPQASAVLPWRSRSQIAYRGVAPSHLLPVLLTWLGMSGYDYKSQDGTTDLEDVTGQYAGTQSGTTLF